MIQVDQGKCGEASGGEILYSGNYCTCIIVGAWDRRLKHAYLLHDEGPFMDQILPEFIQWMLIKSRPEDLMIKVRGGQLLDDDPDHTENNRAYVIEQLHNHFTSEQQDIMWLEPERGARMYIHAATGNFKFEEYDLSDEK